MFAAGLDLGSVNTKLVVLADGIPIFKEIVPSRFDSLAVGTKLLDNFAVKWGTPDKIVVTGYGRVSFPFGQMVTEISCQARGCHYHYPEQHFILDLGGQDSKVIKKTPKGKVMKFLMNDKCAAGTGRFLDVILKAMELRPEELSLPADVQPIGINSMCTVFAESEVITLLAKGIGKAEVIAGLFKSTAKRLACLVESMEQPDTLVFTGGGALYQPLNSYLEAELKTKVLIPPEPELTAALGAALIAWESHNLL